MYILLSVLLYMREYQALIFLILDPTFYFKHFPMLLKGLGLFIILKYMHFPLII